jgi:hypothetical protein
MAAEQCGYEPGANHTLALALGFRTNGSTRRQRAYAGRGDPKDRIGALGDLMRQQHNSARAKPNQQVIITTKTKIKIIATSVDGKGHWKFGLLGRTVDQKKILDDYRKQLRKISVTERDVMTSRRCGQNALRNFLLKDEGKCAVTGLETPELLRASHIRPWSDPNEEDRLNPHNALLLAVHLDAAFDAALISFAEDGKIIFSPRLSQKAIDTLALSQEMTLSNPLRHKLFLAEHRDRLKTG